MGETHVLPINVGNDVLKVLFFLFGLEIGEFELVVALELALFNEGDVELVGVGEVSFGPGGVLAGRVFGKRTGMG